jgi:hypothetical protein
VKEPPNPQEEDDPERTQKKTTELEKPLEQPATKALAEEEQETAPEKETPLKLLDPPSKKEPPNPQDEAE